jgi:hypothetical protein
MKLSHTMISAVMLFTASAGLAASEQGSSGVIQSESKHSLM